ncbi:MAG: hypothetical protein ACXVFN_10520 [Solirubrobacteraceae bacterium]
MATTPPLPADKRASIGCRLLGHDWRFSAAGGDLLWDCRRCGTPGGVKHYDDAASAARYAAAFESERERAGGRFMLSTAPLWLWRRLRRR